MISPLHFLAGAAGLAIVGAVTHVNVVASGGYTAPSAPLVIAVAVALVVGALCVGEAWKARRFGLAVALALGLAAGEGWALLRTAERTIAHRDEVAAPRRAAEALRVKAEARVDEARKSLAASGDSPRLREALTAKAAADAAVQAKASERGCARNCRLLLEQQTEAAAREVAAARAEIVQKRTHAEAELVAAQAAVAALPAPKSTNPLADTLGVDGWKVDLAEAVLASLALNGCGAFLLAFAAHGRSRPTIVHVQSPAPHVPSNSGVQQIEGRDPRVEADWFARATFRPGPGERVPLAELRNAYHEWCRTRGLVPLPDHEIGQALSALFESVGLYRDGTGAEAAIVGIAWKDADRSRTILISAAAT